MINYNSQHTIRLGVVGLGRGFSLMLPTFLMDGRIKLTAAAEPRELARKQFELYLKAPAYQTIEEFFDHADHFDAVYIASPHQYHCEHVCAAADAGKPIMVEKPLALTNDDCDKMIRACQSAGVPLIVGHCHSFNEPYRTAKQLINQGNYGNIRSILAINYTDYLYRARRPEELDTSRGGGAIYSQAAHQVDIVRFLVGEEPSWLHCIRGAWDRTRPTEGAYTALLRFPSNAYASLVYNGYGHFDTDEWMEYIGEMGSVKNPAEQYGSARRALSKIDSQLEEATFKNRRTFGGDLYRMPDTSSAPDAYQHFGPIVISCDHADLRPLGNRILIYGDYQREVYQLPKPAVPRSEVIDELWDVVVGRKPPIHSGVWARNTVKILDAMLKSANSQESIKLS